MSAASSANLPRAEEQENMINDPVISPKPFRLKSWAAELFGKSRVFSDKFPAPVLTDAISVLADLRKRKRNVQRSGGKRPLHSTRVDDQASDSQIVAKLGPDRVSRLEHAFRTYGCEFSTVAELGARVNEWRVVAETTEFSADAYYDKRRVEGYNRRLKKQRTDPSHDHQKTSHDHQRPPASTSTSLPRPPEDLPASTSSHVHHHHQEDPSHDHQRPPEDLDEDVDSVHQKTLTKRTSGHLKKSQDGGLLLPSSNAEGGSQAALARTCMMLLGPTSGLLADFGCGSGLSTAEMIFSPVRGAGSAAPGKRCPRTTFVLGFDASSAMLDSFDRRLRPAADLILADLAQGVPLRPHVLDGAISVGCAHYLCTSGPKNEAGERRLARFLAYPVGGNFCHQFFPHGRLHSVEDVADVFVRATSSTLTFVKDFPHRNKAVRAFVVGSGELSLRMPGGLQNSSADVGGAIDMRGSTTTVLGQMTNPLFPREVARKRDVPAFCEGGAVARKRDVPAFCSSLQVLLRRAGSDHCSTRPPSGRGRRRT